MFLCEFNLCFVHGQIVTNGSNCVDFQGRVDCYMTILSYTVGEHKGLFYERT